MFHRRFALLAEAGDGDGAGDGAAGGGSPEGGQDSQPGGGGERQIPESRLRAALADQERRLRADFEAKLADATKPKGEAPKAYTRAELQAAVDAGQITQAQMDEQLQAQSDERAARVALETVSTAERRRRVDSEIERFKAVAPEILDDAHDSRKDIQKAFRELVALGDDPKDVSTQLKAIRQVLGPIDRLERSRNGRSQHDTHRETGGASGGERRPANGGKLADRLNAGAKAEYQKRIDRGIYKDWDAVEAELKYASAGVKQRLGIA
jgi:hypothetical protein